MVFSNEQELKQHRLREHNEQLSRNERRAALQIPVNLTVRAGGLAFPGPGALPAYPSHVQLSVASRTR